MAYEVYTDNYWRPPAKARKRKESIYPFSTMKPGQYFKIPVNDVKSKQTLYNRINQVAMRQGVLFHIDKKAEWHGDVPIGVPSWYFYVYHDGFAD